MKEGPIFFSDSGIGIHVISYTFFLKDSSARGFQRWFSLICLASESAPLLKLWPSMVLEMKEIVCYLQLLSAKVYQSEEELCSQKMLRSNFKISTSSGFSRSLHEITGNNSVLSTLHSKLSHLVLWMSCANKVTFILSKIRKKKLISCIFSPQQNTWKIPIPIQKMRISLCSSRSVKC